MSHLMTKQTKWHVCLAKTKISLGICPVWPKSSLSAWRKLRPLATHWAHSKDCSDAQANLRLNWMHSHFVCFVMRWLKYFIAIQISMWSIFREELCIFIFMLTHFFGAVLLKFTTIKNTGKPLKISYSQQTIPDVFYPDTWFCYVLRVLSPLYAEKQIRWVFDDN